MNNFTCIIIDDEDFAIGLLTESLKGLYNNIEIIGTYNTWMDGLQALRTQKPDCIFMDISMGSKNGFDLLKLVPNLESELIFITAHAEFALDAFKHMATGYVIKPIRDKDLVIAVDKAMERSNNKKTALRKSKSFIEGKIGIANNSGIDYLDVSDILYFEANEGYTKVITKTATILSSFRIGKVAAILEGMPFYQVHRSYIVNLNYIYRYDSSGFVVMINKNEIPVSRNYRDSFFRFFNTLSNSAEKQ